MKTELTRYKASVTALVLIVSALSISCREECEYKPVSLAVAEFRSVVEGNDSQSPVNLLSISGIGREDSLLYVNRNSISSVSLPMNGSEEETGFVFLFEEETDTIWFSYRIIPWFLSEECGFVLNFELLETRHTVNMIDSVVIVTKEITSFDDTNIRIYH